MLKSLVKSQHEPLKSITIKLTPCELKVFKEKAQEYAGGNMSAWVRHASMKYKPTRSELAD